VVQDCYYRLLRRAHEYDLISDGTRLLYRAITNACINVHTRRREIASLSAPDGERAWEPADPGSVEPGTRLLTRELADQVRVGLGTLPELQRAALELRCMGHEKTEIASILGVSVSNAGVLVHRARRNLEVFLRPYLEEELP
jgi:RNA polymerase sigma-70 factor (ECF subfamily)